jgi:hypothetical protein
MPKLYEHRGFVFYIYSNDHEPAHCHVKKSGRQYKVNLLNVGGVIIPELIATTSKEFSAAEIQIVEDFVRVYGSKIILKWNQYFNGKKPRCEKIYKIKKVGKGGQ